MKRATFFLLVFIIWSWMLEASNSLNSAKPKKAIKPNIIFILADDLGYGDVGFNGQQKVKTPNLDRLAQEGIIFKQHYAGTSVCGPSRAALLTGINTAHANVRELPAWTASGGPIDLKDEEVTIAEELKRAGYTSAVIGKWALDEGGGEGNPLDQGFDYFYGFKTHTEAHHYYPEYIWKNREKVILEGNDCEKKIGTYSNDLFTHEALSFIQMHKESPFFLYLPYTIPHNEITVPEDSKKPYENLGWPKKPMKVGHYHHDEDFNLTFAGMVSRLDDYIGQIMNELKKQGLDENTIILFSSDHGSGFGNSIFNSNAPFKGGKLSLYEGGLRVPFAARWPGKIKAGSTTDFAVSFWDCLPTLCDMAGIKPSLKVDGISYLPTLLGNSKKQKPHPNFYWEVNESQGPKQAVLIGDWKGIKQYEKPFELYNLKTDMGENNNLADKRPDLVKKMEDFMIETRTEHPEFPLTKRKGHY